MTVTYPDALKPRKTPQQARSAVTVDAIFQATIQVLLKEGPRRLTTTRVAERAGVSVGTMYQYFPHKQALLYALITQRLEKVADAVEAVCRRCRGLPLAEMAEQLAGAYVDAKTDRIEASRALYLMAAELDTSNLLGGITRRMRTAVGKMLASTPDAQFENLSDVTFILLAAMAGTTRTVLEVGANPARIRVLRTQLATMCRAYLEAASSGRRH